MLFTSMEFLFLFFPVVILIYFLIPSVMRNYWLLIVSLFFYAWGETRFVIIMICMIIINYVLALRIEELRSQVKSRKLIMILTLVINFSILFIYKYMNFVTHSINAAFSPMKSVVMETNIVLPIGISFFTFQAVSYVIDVYRGIPAQKNICDLALYISFFPQLIAGPIVRYTTIMDQIKKRVITVESFSYGMLRFLYGFNKKVLLANLLANVADKAFGVSGLSVGMAWLGAICYTLQIYYDFSGYSEMAIGLGEMFGFHFWENFNYPYISGTITEFWRRWHISLGTWFRDYVYFPLGGSRVKTKKRLIFNLAVVWALTGIWHGANWTFILWGVLHGIMVIVEKIFAIPNKVEKNKTVKNLYRILVLIVVINGWVLFRADSISVAFSYLKSMYGLTGNVIIDSMFKFYLREYAIILLAAVFCAVPCIKLLKDKIKEQNSKFSFLINGGGCIAQFIFFIISVSFLVMNVHNPFIYFNF